MSFHRTISRLSALLAVVALAKGCGDGESPSAPPMPEPARPTTVTVSPATTELTVSGATVQLSAEVRDQNSNVMAAATVTWTSSAGSVATVNASGLVTGVAEGTARSSSRMVESRCSRRGLASRRTRSSVREPGTRCISPASIQSAHSLSMTCSGLSRFGLMFVDAGNEKRTHRKRGNSSGTSVT